MTGGSIAAKLFNGLVRIGDDLSIRPDIAEKWICFRDGHLYIPVKTRRTISPTREVKADDFKYSFERILDPKAKSPNIWMLEKIIGAKDFMNGRADNIKGINVRVIILCRYVLKNRSPHSLVFSR